MGSDASTATGRVRVATMEGIAAFFLAERFTELAAGLVALRWRSGKMNGAVGDMGFELVEKDGKRFINVRDAAGKEVVLSMEYSIASDVLTLKGAVSKAWTGIFDDEPTKAAAQERRKVEYGGDLVLRKLSDGSERTFADVLEFTLSKDGSTLAYAVGSKKDETNGVYALKVGGSDAPAALLAGKGKYSKLVLDEKQTELAFFSDRDDRRVTHVAIALGKRRLVHVALGRGGFATEKLAENNMGVAVYSTPIVANNVLYISNQNYLYAIEGKN